MDEHVRALLPKLDHVRELARRNVIDFNKIAKRRMIESTRLHPLNYDFVYIEQKRLEVGDSSHLTASFIGPFIVSERAFSVELLDVLLPLRFFC